jgi:hypothetical protein
VRRSFETPRKGALLRMTVECVAAHFSLSCSNVADKVVEAASITSD